MRVWLILNRASRAVAENWEEKLTAAFAARGWTLAGTTDFPQQKLPHPAYLDDVDVVAVAAGDGTINAAAKRLDDWPGLLLVLPGGTMNLLAKALHGTVDPLAIIAAVADHPQTRKIPAIASGDHRAFVGAIVGPGASWVHAREAVRHNRWAKLSRAIRFAWLRSFSEAVHLRDGKRRSPGYRAVFVQPKEGTLSVIRVRAAGWRDGVRLGFTYLTGSWENARGIETSTAKAMALEDHRPVFALFDGEPLHLPENAILRPEQTKLRFIAVGGCSD